jgi:hypothetical protein
VGTVLPPLGRVFFRRLKQHLVGGYGEVSKCLNTTTTISKEMYEYLKRNARQKPIVLDDDKEEDVDDEVEVVGVTELIVLGAHGLHVLGGLAICVGRGPTSCL